MTLKAEVKMQSAGPTSRRVLPPGEYDKEISIKFFCRRVMSPFAKLLWPLLFLFRVLYTGWPKNVTVFVERLNFVKY